MPRGVAPGVIGAPIGVPRGVASTEGVGMGAGVEPTSAAGVSSQRDLPTFGLTLGVGVSPNVADGSGVSMEESAAPGVSSHRLRPAAPPGVSLRSTAPGVSAHCAPPPGVSQRLALLAPTADACGVASQFEGAGLASPPWSQRPFFLFGSSKVDSSCFFFSISLSRSLVSRLSSSSSMTSLYCLTPSAGVSFANGSALSGESVLFCACAR
mmetsp:Transcript_47205/g.102755  ORF Transcript_47205/g.102755 Transcript_47205/m.102755 type:complete len:210 (-) Transcript_47205:109-738(-)